MANTLEWLAYRASQGLRISWYFGQKWLSARLTSEMPAPPELKERMPDRARILADLRALLEQDWRNIEEGHYRLPEDAVALRPLDALRKAGLFFSDLPRVDKRRRSEAHQEVLQAAPPGRYPRYYLQNFHYQTDGYLSRHSAELYDHQVEVLFGGGADAMRRQDWCRWRESSESAACAAPVFSISPAAPAASCARSRATIRSLASPRSTSAPTISTWRARRSSRGRARASSKPRRKRCRRPMRASTS